MMLDHHKKLKFNKKFEPCAIDLEDELYPNGIFVFNVTKMQLYIDQNRALFPVTQAKVDVHCKFSGNLDYAFIESDAIDLNRPVILAEIAPNMYNLIDGHHRIEKAKRLGCKQLSAIEIHPERHMLFLTTFEGYRAYIDYWNKKIDALCRLTR